MSKVRRNGEQTQEARFHRVEMKQSDTLWVQAGDKPTTVWIPAGNEIGLMVGKAMVLDISEVVEHEDIVSMGEKLRDMRRAQVKAEAQARRAKRRLRRGERPTHGATPDPDNPDKPKRKEG